MEKYKFIDNITSDVVFEAYGGTEKDMFINAAHALFEIICKKELIESKEEVEIEVNGTDIDDLLYNWLQTLIAEVDIEEKFFFKFIITEFSNKKIKATIYGEEITPEKGETVVKAVTYHQFKVKKTKDGWMCRVAVDI